MGDSSLSLLRRARDSKPLEDREGLERAYQQGDSYVRNDTMYVAGSHTARDWYDDFRTIPFWGSVRNSERYQQADKMLQANPQVRTVVGHSLGGSVVHQLEQDRPGLRSVTYGAPSISWGTGGERYRNAWDPFSMLDRGAVQGSHPEPFKTLSFTHDYHNTENTSSGADPAVANPDGSVSITE
jgi:hypothetical protein